MCFPAKGLNLQLGQNEKQRWNVEIVYDVLRCSSVFFAFKTLPWNMARIALDMFWPSKSSRWLLEMAKSQQSSFTVGWLADKSNIAGKCIPRWCMRTMSHSWINLGDLFFVQDRSGNAERSGKEAETFIASGDFEHNALINEPSFLRVSLSTSTLQCWVGSVGPWVLEWLGTFSLSAK